MKSVDFDCTIWANVSMLSAVMLFWHSAAALTIMGPPHTVREFEKVQVKPARKVRYRSRSDKARALGTGVWSEQKISSHLRIRIVNAYILLNEFEWLLIPTFNAFLKCLIVRECYLRDDAALPADSHLDPGRLLAISLNQDHIINFQGNGTITAATVRISS
ncbi:hypothetical protein GQX74_012290 [Glossina fuscipes]|nr:hypothetical protein GQX74_012290 [Glossina fuscipes]